VIRSNDGVPCHARSSVANGVHSKYLCRSTLGLEQGAVHVPPIGRPPLSGLSSELEVHRGLSLSIGLHPTERTALSVGAISPLYIAFHVPWVVARNGA
jgi:hypothetical protein